MPNLLARRGFLHFNGESGHGEHDEHDSRTPRGFLHFLGAGEHTPERGAERCADRSDRSIQDEDSSVEDSPRSDSMGELKRFFRPGLGRRSSSRKPHSPLAHTPHAADSHAHAADSHAHAADSHAHAADSHAHAHAHPPASDKKHTQSAFPPSSDSILSLSNQVNVYHDDTLLAQKYGKLGKLLGSGAGGSVKILQRPSDGATFAVKEFRGRKPNEPVRSYAKRCIAEFCMGSSLTHQNIVQFIDIFSDHAESQYYQVMEYCPIDFFSVVMTGKMSRAEVNCAFKQLVRGIRYLHSMGIAHRDLKLENCMMTSDGILKIIDFGSAVVFRYPFEQNVTMAKGIVGSDPYLAPEIVASPKHYDPQYVDIWSLGIIYCCMVLLRFPWKAPRDWDENFRLYAMDDDREHDYVKSAENHERLLRERKDKKLQLKLARHGLVDLPIATPPPTDDESVANRSHETSVKPKVQSNDKNKENEDDDNALVDAKVEEKTSESVQKPTTSRHSSSHHVKKPIHGQYRLMKLLPHAARPLLSQILQIDPAKRPDINEIGKDPWLNGISACSVGEHGEIKRGLAHEHTDPGPVQV